jgi:hypothetical protein
MSNKKKLILTLLVAIAFLTACNLPSAQPTKDANAVFTEAALTVQADLTQKALFAPSATPQPPVVITTTPVPSTKAPPNTPVIVPTATLICDQAQYIADVTIPDGTQFLPDQTFTKTWRLKNTGVCAWNSSYQLIFDSGDLMSGVSPQGLAGNVAANSEVDISVNLKAPSAPGTYRSYWRLRNPAGVLIPIPNGANGKSFFVDIKVVPPSPTPTITATPMPTSTPTLTATLTPTPTSTQQ